MNRGRRGRFDSDWFGFTRSPNRLSRFEPERPVSGLSRTAPTEVGAIRVLLFTEIDAAGRESLARVMLCSFDPVSAVNAGEIPLNDETVENERYELRFQSFCDPARALAFPCDSAGRVDLDGLGERTLLKYLYARAVVGAEFGPPSVRPRPGG